VRSGRRTRLGIALRRVQLRWYRVTQPVLGPFRARWRRSLMLRTMTITGLVTGLIILIAGVFILTSISNDLYSSRRDSALEDSARATLAAQRLIDASDTSDSGRLSTLANDVQRTVQDTSASQMVFLRRQPGQAPFSDAPQSTVTDSSLPEAVSAELTQAVSIADAPQHWQAVSFVDENASPVPGIVVGSSLSFPAGAGTYDLFIGYDLSDTQSTLSFVQRSHDGLHRDPRLDDLPHRVPPDPRGGRREQAPRRRRERRPHAEAGR